MHLWMKISKQRNQVGHLWWCFFAKIVNCKKPLIPASIYMFKVIKKNYQEKQQINLWNMLKINNKDTRFMLLVSIWCLYWSLWTYFTHFFSVSIVNFGQVNSVWKLFSRKSCIVDVRLGSKDASDQNLAIRFCV